MNSAYILRIAAIAIAALQMVYIYVLPGGQTGSTSEWSNGVATISAGSSPKALLWSALGIIFYALLMKLRPFAPREGVPAWWRRAVAFVLDFQFGLITLSGLFALIPLAIEAARTGRFAWNYERHYTVMTDVVIGIPMAFISMGALFLYFVFPLTRGRQTFGCFVTGIKVTPPFGNEGRFTWRAAVRRIIYEGRALCGGRWKRDADGNMRHDLETGSRVVLVDYRRLP